MSLIQSALDRAEQPDSEPIQNQSAHLASAKADPAVIPIPQIIAQADLVTPAGTETHGEPRLNAMRFYETENQRVEEAIRESVRKENRIIEKEETSQVSRKNFLGFIAALLFLSLIASRFLIPSSKPEPSDIKVVIPAAVPAAEKPEPVVVRTEARGKTKPISQIKFLLTGITAVEDTPLAVINNQVVGVGDRLREGATVKSITEKRVVLDLNGRQIVLNF